MKVFFIQFFILFGNGGFIGKYLEASFFNSIITLNIKFSYYFLISIVLILFLISVQFKIIFFNRSIKQLFNFLFKKTQKNYTNQNEVINEFIPQEEIKSLIL